MIRVREIGSGLPFPKADAMWELRDLPPSLNAKMALAQSVVFKCTGSGLLSCILGARCNTVPDFA